MRTLWIFFSVFEKWEVRSQREFSLLPALTRLLGLFLPLSRVDDLQQEWPSPSGFMTAFVVTNTSPVTTCFLIAVYSPPSIRDRFASRGRDNLHFWAMCHGWFTFYNMAELGRHHSWMVPVCWSWLLKSRKNLQFYFMNGEDTFLSLKYFFILFLLIETSLCNRTRNQSQQVWSYTSFWWAGEYSLQMSHFFAV